MNVPREAASPPGVLARYTPDSRRWRRRVSGLAAIGGPLALYAAFAVASGVKSGMVYSLLVLLFGVLALILPAVATATLLAPDSGLTRSDSSGRDDSIETLKRRYAAGEIDHEEFSQRLDDLVATSEDALDGGAVDSGGERTLRDEEIEPAGK